jgi:hypothetical protein
LMPGPALVWGRRGTAGTREGGGWEAASEVPEGSLGHFRRGVVWRRERGGKGEGGRTAGVSREGGTTIQFAVLRQLR